MATAPEAREPAPTWLGVTSLVLLALAVVSNAYLLHLFLEVRSAPAADAIESFCQVSEGFDCVAVAASDYAAFLGIPMALYGLEFYAVAAILVALGLTGRVGLRRWDSLLWWLMVFATPVSVVMAWLSATRVNSLCLLCAAVYGVNFILLVLLGATRRPVVSLFRAGVRTLMEQPQLLRALAVVAAVAMSQFAWVPRLIPKQIEAATLEDPWGQLSSDGLRIGNLEAKVVIEEFSDFQCPGCAAMHGIMLEVMKHVGDRAVLVHRDFPLDSKCNTAVDRELHPQACRAALYARCAAAQGRFWHYGSVLFHNQKQLGDEELKRYAAGVGLDVAQLERCVADPATKAAVDSDIADGLKRRLPGTPSFFINGEPFGMTREERRLLGNLDEWKARIERAQIAAE